MVLTKSVGKKFAICRLCLQRAYSQLIFFLEKRTKILMNILTRFVINLNTERLNGELIVSIVWGDACNA